MKIDTDSALKLAEFFNVSMDYLLCRDEKEAGSPEDEPAHIGLRREKLLKDLEESANTLDVNSLLKVLGYTEGLSKSRKRNHVINEVHKLLICQIIGKFQEHQEDGLPVYIMLNQWFFCKYSQQKRHYEWLR